MKKITFIFLALIMISCEKKGVTNTYLLNTVWEAEESYEETLGGEKRIQIVRHKITFATKDSGTYRVEYESEDQKGGSWAIYTEDIFAYEVNGRSIYLEIDDPPASYSGVISGSKMTLKGLDVEIVFEKR